MDEVLLLKIVYFFTNCILVSYIAFVYTFPKIVKLKFEIFLWIILALILPSMYVLFWSDNLIIDVVHSSNQYLSVAEKGSDYLFYMLPTLLGLLVISIYFFLKAKRFTGYPKTQIMFFWIGSVLMFYPVILLDYIFPLMWGITKYYRWGPVFGLFLNVCIVYSMLTTRFLGVKSIIGNFIKYLIAFIGNATIVFLTYLLIFWGKYDLLSTYSLLLVFLITVPLLMYFNRVFYNYLSSKIDNLYINPYVNFGKEYDQYSLLLEDELDIKKIGNETLSFVDKIFNCDSTMLFIGDSDNNLIIFNKSTNIKYVKDTEILKIIDNWDLINKDKIVLLSEIETFDSLRSTGSLNEWKRMLTFMKYNRIALMYKIPKKIGLHGLIALGFYDEERTLTRIDIKILDDIGSLLSRVIGRSVLYTRTRNFNDELQKMVKEQTKEIMEKMENMERMRLRERDMLDIMGHELRTPLTIIKNASELLEIRKRMNIKREGIAKWDDMVEKQFGHIKNALRRELGLVEMLLSATKLDADRLQVNITTVDLLKAIEYTELAFRKDAQAKGLQFSLDIDRRKKWEVKADNLHTQQILDNLVSNAIKYTYQGQVLIKMYEKDKYIVIEVKDTGEGIGAEELRNLGKKFYRANQYINDEKSKVRTSVVRPGGTGLGLYVTFGLIKAMGGRHEVESKLGKGSTFRAFSQSSTSVLADTDKAKHMAIMLIS